MDGMQLKRLMDCSRNLQQPQRNEWRGTSVLQDESFSICAPSSSNHTSQYLALPHDERASKSLLNFSINVQHSLSAKLEMLLEHVNKRVAAEGYAVIIARIKTSEEECQGRQEQGLTSLK